MNWQPISQEKFHDLLGAVPPIFVQRKGQDMAFACGEPAGLGKTSYTYDFCMFYAGEYFKCTMQRNEFDFDQATQEIEELQQA